MTTYYRKKPYRVGDTVKVRRCSEFYRLAEGLPEGVSVKVIAFDAGWNDVEYKGNVFRVPTACIESGLESLAHIRRLI